MYNSIIVPIDLTQSEKSAAAFELARGLCAKDGKITTVNVIEDVPTYVAAELPGGLLDQSKKDARKDLEQLVKSAGLDAEVEVRNGSPASAILALAEEKGADLIIVAAHRPSLADYLLGSTAARVVRHAVCAVLVIR